MVPFNIVDTFRFTSSILVAYYRCRQALLLKSRNCSRLESDASYIVYVLEYSLPRGDGVLPDWFHSGLDRRLYEETLLFR